MPIPETSGGRLRLAYLVTHPIQYQAPLLRRIAAMPDVDLHVFFQSDLSVRSFHDPGFGQEITWDVPLLDGYEHSFLEPASELDRTQINAWRPISKGLAAALHRGRFDVLWVHGYARPYNLLHAVWSRLRGRGVLVRDDVHKLGNRRRPLREIVKRVQLSCMSGLGMAFLAIGQLNSAYYRELGVAGRRIFLMPYAVDNAAFHQRIQAAAPNRADLRRSLAITSDAPVILYAGKFLPRKRPEDLLEAYRRAAARLEDTPWLVYAGAGGTLQVVRAQASDCPQVRFLGFQNQAQLAALFDLCDFFVMPSATEPWGLVVNEVMNAAKPVIVTDQAGCGPDLVQHGVNGFIYPTGDVEALADRLVELCADSGLRTRMGEASLRTIREWDFEADVRALRQALSSICPNWRTA